MTTTYSLFRLSTARLLALLFAVTAHAQEPKLVQTLTAFDANHLDRFGRQLRADGVTLAVGANNATYVYELSPSGDFLLQQKLWPGGPQNGFPRHMDVELDGDRILLTQPSMGELRLYERSAGSWTQTAVINDPEPASFGADPGFGSTLAMEGTRFVVADLWRAPGTPLEGSSRDGRVWFGDLNSSAGLTEIIPSVRGTEDQFGESMSLRGNVLAVGAPGAQSDLPSIPSFGSPVGRVHVFERDDSGTWNEVQLIVPTVEGSQVLGRGVILEANRLSLLDNLYPDNDALFGPKAGASVYGRNSASSTEPWSLIERVRPVGGNFYQSFGVDGDRMVFRRLNGTGVPTSITESRSIEGNWSTESILRNGMLNQHRSSRLPVLYLGDYLIAGANEAVNIYEVRPRQLVRYCAGFNSCEGCPCGSFQQELGGCQNSESRLASLVTEGRARLQSDTFRIGAEGLISDAFALLFAGTNRLPVSTLGCETDGEARPYGLQFLGSNGLRCVGGTLRRLGTRQADADGTIDPELGGWGSGTSNGSSIALELGAAAGQTWNLQVFYRDNPFMSCTGSINTTDAVSVTYLP